MEFWPTILDVLLILLTALILGTLAERLRQSAMLGYLLAGTLLGPNALNWVSGKETVTHIAELGVALLLFGIGLEFSWRRLRSLGPLALGGGTAQVLLTMAAVTGIGLAMGASLRVSACLGAILSLSSTACVLSLLTQRSEIDSGYGRNALGILLLQDIAVVPLVLFVTVLGGTGGPAEIGWEIGRAILALVGFALAFRFLSHYVIPPLLGAKESARNRELPILLAIVMFGGAAWGAHHLGLSPALGAFVAGMLIGDSPFAVQIRSDVSILRTLFVTLFFSSIGMLGDPLWALQNAGQVTLLLVAILVLKSSIIFGIVLAFRSIPAQAIATGICLAQSGEFSFVLAEIARQNETLSADLHRLAVSAIIGTLFLTPALVSLAPRVARWVAERKPGRGKPSGPAEHGPREGAWTLLVGFGPAGQRFAEKLLGEGEANLVVVDLNPKLVETAQTYGLPAHVGDASRQDMLEHLRLDDCRAVVVTIPDPTTSRHVIERVRSIWPEASLLARARYHVYRWELLLAGAEVVVDEEEQVGHLLAQELQRCLSETDPPPTDT